MWQKLLCCCMHSPFCRPILLEELKSRRSQCQAELQELGTQECELSRYHQAVAAGSTVSLEQFRAEERLTQARASGWMREAFKFTVKVT